MADQEKTVTFEAPLNNVPNVSEEGSIEDLIPSELKAVVEKQEAENKPVVTEENPKENTPIEKTPSSKKEVQIEVSPEDETSVDISDEGINNLLKGKIDSPKNSASEGEDEDKPYWHDDPEYKNILQNSRGVDQKSLDKIIRAAADKKVVDTSKVVQSLEKKIEDSKATESKLSEKIDRLQKIERAAHFDNTEEAQEKFFKPMNESAQALRKTLELEGVNIPLQRFLLAKDKAALTALLRDENLDDDSIKEIASHWKAYKEVEHDYNNTKTEAQKDLRKFLSTNISPEKARDIVRSGLKSLLKEEKYSYIQKAIEEGVDGHEDVKNILDIGQRNFFNIVKAISNPSEFAHNSEWLEALAKFTFDAAHATEVEIKHKELQKNYTATEDKLRKIAVAYKNLLKAGKGINGTNAVISGRNGKSESYDVSSEKKQFEKLLTGAIDIEDILPKLAD